MPHGTKIISTKWLDTNKGDELHPDLRSRLVGRELKMDARVDLFSATPPLETMKFLISLCSRGQYGPQKERLRIASIDIKRAYFYAAARRDFYISIPEEDRMAGGADKVAKLKLSLYGTRDAAQNWAAEYTGFLQSLGFQKGVASPCSFNHHARNINMTVHGDDFLIVASDDSLQWLKYHMEKKYQLKYNSIGPDEENDKELRILNRIIRWGTNGIEYEADPRHAEIVVETMGVQGLRQVSTPGVTEVRKAAGAQTSAEVDTQMCGDTWVTGDSKLLCHKDATIFRSVVARINFLAQDRGDIQFASKCASSGMANPTEEHWQMLLRLSRYLKDHLRLVQHFRWARADERFEACTDSDWAGDRKKAKSTSGGVLL